MKTIKLTARIRIMILMKKIMKKMINTKMKINKVMVNKFKVNNQVRHKRV
jgi:hypothetical protein